MPFHICYHCSRCRVGKQAFCTAAREYKDLSIGSLPGSKIIVKHELGMKIPSNIPRKSPASFGRIWMNLYKGPMPYDFGLLRLFPMSNSFNYPKIARKEKSSISQEGGIANETFEKESCRADVAEYVRQRRAVYDIGFGSGIVDLSTRRLFSIACVQRIWIISSCSLQNHLIHFKIVKSFPFSQEAFLRFYQTGCTTAAAASARHPVPVLPTQPALGSSEANRAFENAPARPFAIVDTRLLAAHQPLRLSH